MKLPTCLDLPFFRSSSIRLNFAGFLPRRQGSTLWPCWTSRVPSMSIYCRPSLPYTGSFAANSRYLAAYTTRVPLETASCRALMRQRHLSGRFHGRITLRYFFQTFKHVLRIVYLPTSSFLPSPDKVVSSRQLLLTEAFPSHLFQMLIQMGRLSTSVVRAASGHKTQAVTRTWTSTQPRGFDEIKKIPPNSCTSRNESREMATRSRRPSVQIRLAFASCIRSLSLRL